MNHYVCPECGSESKSVGMCLNEFCTSGGSALVECHCEDGKHGGIVRGSKEEASDDEFRENRGGTIDLDGEGSK